MASRSQISAIGLNSGSDHKRGHKYRTEKRWLNEAQQSLRSQASIVDVLTMTNRQLTSDELTHLFAPLAAEVRSRLRQLAGDDNELHWALRRKLAKELIYDERSTPNERRKLKQLKHKEQGGNCMLCKRELPPRYNVLDRLEAMKGYTPENTQLICQACDVETQRRRGYK